MVITSRAKDFGFDSRSGQNGHSVAEGLSLLQHFFCAAQSQNRENGPHGLATRFGIYNPKYNEDLSGSTVVEWIGVTPPS